MVKLSYISAFGPKTRKNLKKKGSKVIFTSVINLKSISCKSLGATEHTKSCHKKFDWLHLELHESLEIKHLEVKTATINLKLYY